ncbi:MAG TPA: neutral/alkaline non-lysosomal ceramidase N-terminal domain-containing protein [Clostridiales bacterium]|nr:neutral/alkaline non-lysosomal ceramidase N-terminal domain-containing protein [Clostridiales bacterium]
MKAAAKSIDITPAVGIPMGGNVREDDKARGIHDNLYCNAILLEENGKEICFLGFDLLGLNFETCRNIKESIREKTGLATENIVINATHTHSGPDTLGIFKESMDESCRKYIEEMVDKVSREVSLLPDELKEANLAIARNSVYELSFNRRLVMKDGSMRMNWEDVNIEDVLKETGPIDPELNVLMIEDNNKGAIAVIVNFTLHPAVLVGKDWLWSRDYINYLTLELKNKLGGDIVVLFANGSEGNVNHINYKDKNQGRGFEEAERIGSILAKHVIETLNNKKSLKSKQFKSLSRNIKLPLRTITNESVQWAEKLLKEKGDFVPSLLDGVPDEIYAREILKLSKVKDKSIETEIQVIQIDDTVIATLPGEVFVEFGLKIKKESPFKNTLVFGLANDMIGYIPTEISFEEGGYEIKTAWSSKLDPRAGDVLASQVLDLIKEISNLT